MATRGSFLVVTSLLVLAAIGSGCAKRPATTQAAAPAPTGTASTMAPSSSQPGGTTATPSGPSMSQPGGGTATPTPAPAAPAPAARPEVRTFVAVPELQDVFFDFDKYDIRPADTRTLDANAAWLKSNPNHLVLIEGHADERGTNEYNLALGDRRANAVRDYLASLGIGADRLLSVTKGEETPVCTEDTESCWSRNRRGAFVITAK